MLAGSADCALPQSPAWAQADFFKGKTVTLVVGSRVTGSLSIGAQIMARHIGKHIPGNPIGILRQMPGGAHLNATNYVYNVAEPDGLTILAANPQVAMAQLVKVSAVRFDVQQIRMARLIGLGGRDLLDPPRPAVQDVPGAQERRSTS